MLTMTMGPGMSTATPDVCLTPAALGAPVPIPYPNIGNNALVIPAYFTLLIQGMPELNTMGMYAMTSGDEPGVQGGVTSGTTMGTGRPVVGSMVNFLGGAPVWLMSKPTLQNLNNASGTTMAPSQTIKMVTL